MTTTKTTATKKAAATEVAYTTGPKHWWPALRDGALLLATTWTNVDVAPDNAARALRVTGPAAARKAADVALTSFWADAMAALKEQNATRADALKEQNRTAAGRAQRFADEREFFAAYAAQLAKPTKAKGTRKTTKAKGAA